MGVWDQAIMGGWMEAANNGLVSGWKQVIMGGWVDAGNNEWVDRSRQ